MVFFVRQVFVLMLSFGFVLFFMGQGYAFSDFPQDQGEAAAVTMLLEKKILTGYADDTLRLSQSISRAEMLALVMRAVKMQGEQTIGNSSFSDVLPGEWYSNIIAQAFEKKIVRGYEDGTFRPHRLVNRAEAYALALRVFMPDKKEYGRWYDIYFSLVDEHKLYPTPIIVGDTYAYEEVTRGEILLMLANILQYQEQHTERYERFVQSGTISYYADNLAGNGMSSGQKYDPMAFSAAHVTRAFDSLIQVVDVKNKKSVLVPVKDRGPHTKGFITDLSRQAFEALGSTRRGIFSGKNLPISSATQITFPKKLYDVRSVFGFDRSLPSYMIQGQVHYFSSIAGTPVDVTIQDPENGQRQLHIDAVHEEYVLFDKVGKHTVIVKQGDRESIYSVGVHSPFSGYTVQEGLVQGVKNVQVERNNTLTLDVSWEEGNDVMYGVYRVVCFEGNKELSRTYIVDHERIRLSTDQCPLGSSIEVRHSESSTPFAHDVFRSFVK